MPDYLPIPGEKNDLPEDDLSRLASERASNLLMPYGQKFGLKPIVNSPSAANPNPGMGLEDKLYQSVHPDTFSKVLEMIMQMVTGRPIPTSRQEGGPVNPFGTELWGRKQIQDPFGSRVKGPGFFGRLDTPSGGYSTEISIGVDGEEIPSLVPTLTRDEINYLLGGGSPTTEIVDKAATHARWRKQQGLNPFAQRGTLEWPLPKERPIPRQFGGMVEPSEDFMPRRKPIPDWETWTVPGPREDAWSTGSFGAGSEDLWARKQSQDWRPGASRLIGGQRVSYGSPEASQLGLGSTGTPNLPMPTPSWKTPNVAGNLPYMARGGMSTFERQPGITATTVPGSVQTGVRPPGMSPQALEKEYQEIRGATSVEGMPLISRQEGGPVYVVGERGPEILEMYPEGGGYVHPIPRQYGGGVEEFRPAVPGTIYSGRQEVGHTYPDLTYAGGGERRWNPLTGTRTPGELWNQQLSAGPLKPAQGFALPERIPLPFPFMELRRRETPLQIPGESFLPETAGARRLGDVTTIPPIGGGIPAPRRREEFMEMPGEPPSRATPPTPGGDWIEAEGGRYKVGPERWFAGGREVPAGIPGAMSGDVMARERLFRETPRLGEGAYAAGGGYGGGGGYAVLRPGERSYYDVHPEERRAQEIYDMLRGPHPDSYEAARERMQEMNLRDIAGDPTTTREARMAASEQLKELQLGRFQRETTARKAAGDIYGQALQYGPETPGGMESIARAENLRMMPWAHLAGITEQSRAHLEGINREVAGRLGVAKISADTKNQMMADITKVLAEGYKNPMFFDANSAISNIVKGYRGSLTDEQWAALPEEWKVTPTIKYRVKGKGIIELKQGEEATFLRQYPKAEKVS